MRPASRTFRCSLGLLGLTSTLACSGEDPPPPPDAGPADAGPSDSGTPLAPSIIRFTASEAQPTIGTSVTLRYEVQTATAVQITQETAQGITSLLSSATLSGAVESQELLGPTTFRLRAVGVGRAAEQTVRVEVQIPEITILDFGATPNPALPGESITVAWRVSGADRVQIRSDAGLLVTTSSEANQGQRRIRGPARSAKLILEASTRWRTRTQSLLLFPRGAAEVFDLSLTPSVLPNAEGSVQLSWQARGESVALWADQAPIGAVAPGTLTGSVTVPLPRPTLYTLRVAGLGRIAAARRIAVPNGATEQEPNDGLPQAQALSGGVFGRTDAPGDLDVFRLQLPNGGHLFVDLSASTGGCAGLGLRVLDTQGQELIERDAGDLSPCPRLDPYEDPAVRSLPAGDYYVAVDGRRRGVEYHLATLALEGRCGDGLRDGAEQCDDGGSAGGDGCSSSCTLEIVETFTVPGAPVQHADALGVGEVDYYRLLVTSTTSLAIETGVPALGACQPPGDTQLALLDETYAVVARNDDALGLCAALRVAPPLAIGTYFLQVRSFAPGSPIPAYQLGLRGLAATCGDEQLDAPETCDDGNTTGGDGCSATCVIERLPSPQGQIQLPLRPGAVRRVEVELTVPGQSITATTSDGQGGCAIDTRLILAKDGRYLGYDGGGAGCGHLRPRTHPFAANLAPGLYQLLVVGEGNASGPVTLEVRIDDPACGNGILETLDQEFCDDGNLVDNDGCSPTCEQILGGEVSGPGGPAVVFSGAFDPLTGPTTYGLDLLAPGNLFAEIGIPVIGQCSGPGDPVLQLFDANQNFVAYNDDFNGLCSAIRADVDPAARLPAGRYLLQVGAFSFEPIPAYQVQIELRAVGCGNQVLEAPEECDDGNLTPGDGCSELCLAEP